MLLAIDIGNTNITFGVFKRAGKKYAPKPVGVWRAVTNHSETEDEYALKVLAMLEKGGIRPAQIAAVAVASVVPVLDGVFENLIIKYFKKTPYFVKWNNALLKMKYSNPAEVGADRIADAVAAYEFFGGPCVIIDFGTATTFDCVDKAGVYLGGVIAPGPKISAESLAKHTAKLPEVEIVKTKSAIGKSTAACIQAGLYFGYIGLVKEILYRIKKEMKGSPKVIATGGLAPLIVPSISEVKEVSPDLTLEGIRLLWEKSQRFGG